MKILCKLDENAHFQENACILCKLDENARIFKKMRENANLNNLRFRRPINIGLSFCKHPELRAGLGSAGAITMFIEKIQDEDIKTQNKYPLINALCLCAHEAVNRVRIRETKGLELLLKLLDDTSFKLIHNRLISSLVCFLYDEASFEVLLGNRLVPILLQHLVRIAKLNEMDGKNESLDSKREDSKEVLAEANELLDELFDRDEENKDQVGNTDSIGRQKTSKQSEESSASQPVVQKIKSLENTDFKRSQSCPSLPTDDTDDSKSKVVKYSMDSPTYQAISFEKDNEDDYFSGPKNIVEAQQYFSESAAGGMSPWSYSTGGVSPYRSPTGSISPHRSSQSSAGGLSPYRSPTQLGPYSPLSVSSITSSHSPETSPQGSISPKYSVTSPGAGSTPGASSSSIATNSPSIRSMTSFSPLGSDVQAVPSSSQPAQWTPLSSPDHLDSPVLLDAGSPMWSSGTTTTNTDDSNEPRYSSEEEDDGNLEENVTLSETCVTSLGDSCASVLSTDPLFLDVASTSTADPAFKVPETSARNTPSSSQSASKSGSRKKRRLSEETKVRIQKSVERSSASAPSSPRVIESIMKQRPTYSEDEYDLNPELPKLKDPIKVTEHNILVLLSRVSYTTNPSQHLINQSCLNVLLDYILLAVSPFPRCGRILARLTKNPHCFEPLILCLGPSLIQAKLCSYNVNQVLQKEAKKQSAKTPSSSDCAASTSTTSPPAKRSRLDVNIATKTDFR